MCCFVGARRQIQISKRGCRGLRTRHHKTGKNFGHGEKWTGCREAADRRSSLPPCRAEPLTHAAVLSANIQPLGDRKEPHLNPNHPINYISVFSLIKYSSESLLTD